MINWELVKAQRELIDASYSKGSAYTKVVIGAGYAGFFAIWSLSKSELSPTTSFAALMLIGFSLASFIAWELFSMLVRSKADWTLALATDNPETFEKRLQAHKEEHQKQSVRLAILHPWIVGFTAVTGFVAIAIMISAFCHGLWSELVKTIPTNEVTAIGTSTALVIGGAIAGIFGWVFSWLAGVTARRQGKKFLRIMLSEEMKVSEALYGDLRSRWQEDGSLWFHILQEIDSSRVDYQEARQYMGGLRNDLRLKVMSYYRKSGLILSRLSQLAKQNEDYKQAIRRREQEIESTQEPAIIETLRAELELGRGLLADNKTAISEKLNELEQQQGHASHLAHQLSR